MQVGTTKDQGSYNKPSAAVHPGALAAGTLPQYNTIQYIHFLIAIRLWHVRVHSYLYFRKAVSENTDIVFRSTLNYTPTHFHIISSSLFMNDLSYLKLVRCKVPLYAMKPCRGSRGIAPLVLNIGAR